MVSTEGSGGAATAASEIRSLAGEQVAVELAARAAAQAGLVDAHLPGRRGAGA